MNIDQVGLIGAGLMGHGIASNILRNDYALAYLVHPGNRPTADLDALGGRPTRELGDLVQRSDVVLICVTGSPQVEEIVLAENGLASRVRSGQIVVDLSTVEPATTSRVHAAIDHHGGVYMDIPMTRTPMEAEAGRLNLLAGGDTSTLETLRPLLSTFAENIYHAGPVGAGHALKLLHNFVSLGHCAVLAEAAACAAKTDVDMMTFLEVLKTGGGDSVALKRLYPYITAGDEAGFLFTLGNCAKDMSYYADMAQARGCASDTAVAIRDLYKRLSAGGNEGLPVPRMVDLLDRKK